MHARTLWKSGRLHLYRTFPKCPRNRNYTPAIGADESFATSDTEGEAVRLRIGKAVEEQAVRGTAQGHGGAPRPSLTNPSTSPRFLPLWRLVFATLLAPTAQGSLGRRQLGHRVIPGFRNEVSSSLHRRFIRPWWRVW